MITESYIEKIIKQYASSPEGRRKIKEQYGIDYDPKFNASKAKLYGLRMQNILFKYVNSVIKSVAMEDIIVSDPYVGEDMLYRIDISFRDGSLHRESLDPEVYDGIGNIVLLFTKGYHARGQVHGIWHTNNGDLYVGSRTDREPNDFLQNAVDSFNAGAKGVAIAMLKPKYKN